MPTYLWIAGCENGNGGEFSATSGTVTADSAVKRTGNYSLKCNSAAAYAQSPQGFAAAVAVFRFYFRFETAPSGDALIAKLLNSSLIAVADLYLSSDRILYARAVGGALFSGSTVLSTGTQYLIEIAYVTAGTGLTVYLSGSDTEEITASGSGGTNCDCVRAYSGTNSNPPHYFDDMAVCTGVSIAAARPKAGQIEALRPNGAGNDSADWTNTYANLDDEPYDDASERVKTASTLSAFTHDLTTIASVGTINDVVIGVRYKRGTGAGSTHKIHGRDPGISTEELLMLDALGAGPGTSYSYLFARAVTTKPANQTKLDAYQAGIYHTGAQDSYVSEIYVMVDRTPSGSTPITASDTLTISTPESTVNLKSLLARADPLSLSLSELRTVVGFLDRSDALSLSLDEARSLLNILARSDTLDVSLGEAAQIAITALIAASDGLSISLGEARTLISALAQADVLTLQISEGAPGIFGASSRTDTLAVSLIETMTILAALTRADNLDLTATELAQIAVLVGVQDSLSLSLGEARQLLGFLGRSDDLAASLGEVRELLVTLSRSDALVAALGEARDVSVILQVAEALNVSLDEAREIVTLLASADLLTLSLGEMRTLFSESARADDLSLSVAEARTLISLLARTDSLMVSLPESVSLKAMLLAADSLNVSLADAGQLIAILQIVADTLGVSLSEIAAVLTFGVIEKTASDSLAITLAEAAGIQALIVRNDALSIAVSDLAQTIQSTVQRADSLSISAIESAIILSILGRADTCAVGMIENTLILALLQRADTAALSLTETANIINVLLRSDILSLALAEARAIKTQIETADVLTVSLPEAVAALESALARADMLSVSLSEARAILVNLERADPLALTLGETTLLMAALSASDVLALAGVDVAAVVNVMRPYLKNLAATILPKFHGYRATLAPIVVEAVITEGPAATLEEG